MNNVISSVSPTIQAPFSPALVTRAADMPWIPTGPGKSFKPLRFMKNDRGWSLLLRLEPRAVIGRHRHTGEVHATNLEGRRQLATGEIIHPGDYVYEPAGNVDSWAAMDEPLIVHVIVYGAVEYLDDRDQVTGRSTCATQYEAYRRHCQANGLRVADLSC